MECPGKRINNATTMSTRAEKQQGL